ncbi:hypothetical protein PPOP_1543 [Paenibacillus popilliae ATCC 14706]|uniref:Uncharacterized protein n=1 Tax=Paenibacillus popilliae ATCC 14706 TaxID=1212764 RepID=M9LP38_PAEPP|nr:hypothetical protein PPOP_1543 [Paenibacillus popilliae ATCC 14706]
MLGSEGAPYFRSRFVQHNIEEFKKDVDVTKGKNLGQNKDIVAEFVSNAYVAVIVKIEVNTTEGKNHRLNVFNSIVIPSQIEC